MEHGEGLESLVFPPILFERTDEAGTIGQPNSTLSGLWYEQGMIWRADLLLTSWHPKVWNMSHEPSCWHLRNSYSENLVMPPILFEATDEAGIKSKPNSMLSRLWYDQGIIWWADLLLTFWHAKMWNMSHEPIFILYCGFWEPTWWCF